MTQTITYSDPLGGWSVALSNVRRNSLTTTERAESGQIGTGTLTIDDDAGTAGHSSDGTLGLKTLVITQDTCSISRTFSGFVVERGYSRGSEQIFTSSTGRQIDVSLVDLNAKAGFLRITGADGNRSSETVAARLVWLLGSPYAINLFSASSYNDTSTVLMDAADYRGQTPGDVIADCAIAAKGFNWFIFYDPAAAADVLWFANSNTSTAYTSTIQISNVKADADSTTTFAPEADWRLVRQPARVVSGVYLPYANGATYQTRTATGSTYAFRDGTAPTATVKSAVAAVAIAKQFLWENHTEEDRLTVKIRMRAAYVNLIRQGMRLQVKLSNIPEYTSYVYFRVLSRTVTQPLNQDSDYDVELELSPQEDPLPVGAILQIAHGYGQAGGLQPLSFTDPLTIGSLLVVCEDRWKGNGTDPIPPNITPGSGATIGGTGAWNLLTAIVHTAASGDRSHIGVWTKTATAVTQSGPVFSAFTWITMYEIANVTVTGATIVSKDIPGASGVLDAGSLASPATGAIGIYIAGQYSPDVGPMSFSASPWTTDVEFTSVYFGSSRPYWQGHFVCDGSALEAQVASSISYPWCGIGVALPAV